MSDPSDFCIGCINDEYPEGLHTEIESLRQQLALYKAMTKEYGLSVFQDIKELQEQLAESQAREKVLCEALNSFELRDDEVLGFWQTSLTASQVNEALAVQSDSTALDAAIRLIYEDCAEAARRIRKMAKELDV